MVRCNRCGAVHKDWEISLSIRSERHSEVDTRQYESYLVCPICGSADLEDFEAEAEAEADDLYPGSGDDDDLSLDSEEDE